MWYCKFLDLPAIPDNLINQIDTNNPGVIMRDYKGWDHYKDGVAIKSSDNPFYFASAELQEWLALNVCSEFNDVGIRYAYGKADVNTAGIHTDSTRKYVLQYNLDNGGGHLNFWQEKGKPLLRDGRVTINNYNQVDLVESVQTPNNQWYLINAMVLHSVEALVSTRVNVQISLMNNPFDK
jgi:hypothetical protein